MRPDAVRPDDAVQLVLDCAAQGSQPLTVLEIGGGAFARALLREDCRGIEEVVVVSSSVNVASLTDGRAAPVAVSAWKGSCKHPAQLLKLRAALVKEGRQRVAAVCAAPAPATLALRCVQLHLSLSSMRLLVLAPELPQGLCSKAVLRAGGAQTALAQLPKGAARAEAWLSFLCSAATSGDSSASAASGVVVARRCDGPVAADEGTAAAPAGGGSRGAGAPAARGATAARRPRRGPT